jgi:hypothetical protein
MPQIPLFGPACDPPVPSKFLSLANSPDDSIGSRLLSGRTENFYLMSDAVLLEKLAVRWLARSHAERTSFATECPVFAREISEEADRWLTANLHGASVRIDKPDAN